MMLTTTSGYVRYNNLMSTESGPSSMNNSVIGGIQSDLTSTNTKFNGSDVIRMVDSIKS